MRSFSRSISAVLAAAFVGASPAFAIQSPVTDAQNKLLARRAAEADAYRKLAETVNGVQLTSDTYVRDFVAESDEIRTAVDTFIKGIRLGSPRYYDDGTCEVDAEVTVRKLVTELKQIHQKHYKGRTVTTTDIERVREYFKTDVIRVTGAGAPRPELPPDLPMGVEDVITPLPPDLPITRSVPPIWRTVPGQARLMAERAARVDAMRKLLEQIKGLRLTSDTLVRDFITESDEIRTRADGIVYGAVEVGKFLHQDDLIVEVTMEVPVERVVTKIKELHSQHYRGNRVTTTDITNIKKSVQREMIRATGSGVPPARFLEQARSAGVQMPSWMGERITATGEATDQEMHTAQGKLRAARAAQLDAMRKLTEQVYGLRIDSETSVRDFVTQYDEIATQVSAVLAGAVADEPEFVGDTARVTVSIPAAGVWSVLGHHQRVTQRGG